MKASIIIPTYNQSPQFLRAALMSAKYQTMPCEIIIVDDGSRPMQSSVVESVMSGYTNEKKEFGVAAKYVWQENAGVAGALNRGIKESTGDVIQWLPSDDVYVLCKTADQIKMIDRYPDCRASYCSYEDGIPQVSSVWPAVQHATKEKLLECLCKRCFINAATVMFKRELIDEVGFFDLSYRHAQDYEFLLRLAQATNFAAIDRVLVRRRVHAGQMSQTLVQDEEREAKKDELKRLNEKYGSTAALWTPDGRQ